jgi:quercetin dioxygenase-like cupin family protein
MIVKKIAEVSQAPVEMEGAKDVKVRVVFGPQDEAPTFALREFELAPGGHTPHHSHPFEHEVVVTAGEIIVLGAQGEVPMQLGDVVLMPPNEKHQFQNPSSSKPAKMLCLVPVEYQK